MNAWLLKHWSDTENMYLNQTNRRINAKAIKL